MAQTEAESAPPLLAWRRFAGIVAGLLAYLAFLGLSRLPGVAESLYGKGVGPVITSILSRVTGLIPISLVELAIVAFLLRQVWGAYNCVVSVRRKVRGAVNAVAFGLLRFASDLGWTVALFYVLWGFNFAREPLERVNGWDVDQPVTTEVAALARELVDATNDAYLTLHGSPDRGSPTGPILEFPELARQLDRGWAESGAALGNPSSPPFGFGKPKPLLLSPILDHLGLSGFYFPWTGETIVNRGMPALLVPLTMAHEMAHQRGFAREDEANFAAFVVASTAAHPFTRYSAYFFAQRKILDALSTRDRELLTELTEQRLPGVQRDLDAAWQYWIPFRGRPRKAARAVNNAYLRVNRVADGLDSYDRCVLLLVAYARTRGGRLCSEVRHDG